MFHLHRQETNAAVLSVVVKDTMKARDKDGVWASAGPWWDFFPIPLLPSGKHTKKYGKIHHF